VRIASCEAVPGLTETAIPDDTLPLAAVIVAEPTSLAVTTPFETVAMFAFDEDQVIPLLPRDRLSLVKATAVSVAVFPDARENGAPGVISTRATALSGPVGCPSPPHATTSAAKTAPRTR